MKNKTSAVPEGIHDNVVRRLARTSPRSFAKIIALRSGAMTSALGLLWKTACGSARPFWKSFETKIPCPHCLFRNGVYRCPDCLWTKAAREFGVRTAFMACKSIRFGGLTLSDVTAGHKYVKTNLFPEGAYVTVSIPDRNCDPKAEVTAAREYEECMKYLSEHERWALGDNWGARQAK
jgi:hypothetical protein